MFFQSNHPQEPAKLFEKFKKGDPEAFQYFYELHHQSLFCIIFKITGNTEEAKDIVADAFYKLANNLLKINDPGHLWRYLFIVARNGAIDYFRKLETSQKARQEIGQLSEIVYTEPKDTEIIFAQAWEKVNLAIQRFPVRRKRIFLLFYFFEKDTRSIAKQLNLKEQTVRNQLNRAIVALRKALQ